jgi:beta-N-acetylhexosaminidase
MHSFPSRLAVFSIAIAALAAASAIPRKPAQAKGAKASEKTAATPVKTPARAAKPVVAQSARGWLNAMTLERKAAQLVFVQFNGAAPNPRTREYQRYARLVRDVGVGGLILVNWSKGRVIQKAEPHALAAFVNRMQGLSKTPLFISGDFERGASMRVDGTTGFPHAMAFAAAGDPELTRRMGMATAREARAMGVHWVFHPVADVNNNPDNPIINIRSFGEEPETVAAHVRAFIEGAQAEPKKYVLTSAKHFPGHGDTAIDTHMNMASIASTREQLEQMELLPFRAAVAAGVDSIMSAHIAAPALAPADVPATLSPDIMTGLLRDDMGFKGLVVTDALEMGGIVKGFSNGEAAVLAIEAGADVLLMPVDPDAAIRAIVSAVRAGRLSEKRIDESVSRVLEAKVRVGLHRSRLVDSAAIGREVNTRQSNELAREVAERAVTLVRNEGRMLPLAAPGAACYVVLAESARAVGGRAFAEEVRRRAPRARVIALDPGATAAAVDSAVRQAAACDSVVVAAFASVAAYRGSTALPGRYTEVVERLAGAGKPVAMVALGNPYLLRSFPAVNAYMATYSTTPVSEAAAVRALFGEIPIGGRLPVSIPGLARVGDGIAAPARTAAAQTTHASVP